MSSSVVILTSKWNGSNAAAGAIVAVVVVVAVDRAVSWCVPCGRRLETVAFAVVRVNRSPSPFVCVVSRFFTCDNVDDDEDEDDK
jgi:hypothetical protein